MFFSWKISVLFCFVLFCFVLHTCKHFLSLPLAYAQKCFNPVFYKTSIKMLQKLKGKNTLMPFHSLTSLISKKIHKDLKDVKRSFMYQFYHSTFRMFMVQLFKLFKLLSSLQSPSFLSLQQEKINFWSGYSNWFFSETKCERLGVVTFFGVTKESRQTICRILLSAFNIDNVHSTVSEPAILL